MFQIQFLLVYCLGIMKNTSINIPNIARLHLVKKVHDVAGHAIFFLATVPLHLSIRHFNQIEYKFTLFAMSSW